MFPSRQIVAFGVGFDIDPQICWTLPSWFFSLTAPSESLNCNNLNQSRAKNMRRAAALNHYRRLCCGQCTKHFRGKPGDLTLKPRAHVESQLAWSDFIRTIWFYFYLVCMKRDVEQFHARVQSCKQASLHHELRLQLKRTHFSALDNKFEAVNGQFNVGNLFTTAQCFSQVEVGRFEFKSKKMIQKLSWTTKNFSIGHNFGCHQAKDVIKPLLEGEPRWFCEKNPLQTSLYAESWLASFFLEESAVLSARTGPDSRILAWRTTRRQGHCQKLLKNFYQNDESPQNLLKVNKLSALQTRVSLKSLPSESAGQFRFCFPGIKTI